MVGFSAYPFHQNPPPLVTSAICRCIQRHVAAAVAAAEGVNLFWWEPTAAPTKVVINLEGSLLPMVPSV